jgi:hypothetical protein
MPCLLYKEVDADSRARKARPGSAEAVINTNLTGRNGLLGFLAMNTVGWFNYNVGML